MTISNDPFDYVVPTIEDVTFVQSDHCSCQSSPISVDEGLTYGMGFFETILVLDKPIFLDEHLERLNHSLHHFHIKIRITSDLVQEIISLCGISNKALKILVSESNTVVSFRPLTYTSQYYEQGAKLMLSQITRSSRSFLVHHKSANYGDMILSLRQAHDLEYNDCLFFNEKGYLTESAIANVFIIKNNQLLTPATNQGLLPGIVRNYLLQHYNVIEGIITIDDLVYADAVFLTNSLVGIVKVSSIDFDKKIIRQHRLQQVSDTIPDQVTYAPHPLIKSITFDYNTHIRSNKEAL